MMFALLSLVLAVSTIANDNETVIRYLYGGESETLPNVALPTYNTDIDMIKFLY